MSKRQDIEIIRRERKVSFKEARRIYKANGESLIDSLIPIPPRVVNISSFNPVTIEAVRIYPRYIDDKVNKEHPYYIKDDIARGMIKKIGDYLEITKEPYRDGVMYRGTLRILVREGGYYED